MPRVNYLIRERVLPNGGPMQPQRNLLKLEPHYSCNSNPNCNCFLSVPCSPCPIIWSIKSPSWEYSPNLSISTEPNPPIQEPAQILPAAYLHCPSEPYKLPWTSSTSLLALTALCYRLCNCPIFSVLDQSSSLRCDFNLIPPNYPLLLYTPSFYRAPWVEKL